MPEISPLIRPLGVVFAGSVTSLPSLSLGVSCLKDKFFWDMWAVTGVVYDPLVHGAQISPQCLFLGLLSCTGP